MEHIHSGPVTGWTVLVTGGSGGIGRATALGLATMGTHLVITGRDRARTEDAAREVGTAGSGQVDVFVADLSSQAAGAAAGRRGPPSASRAAASDVLAAPTPAGFGPAATMTRFYSIPSGYRTGTSISPALTPKGCQPAAEPMPPLPGKPNRLNR